MGDNWSECRREVLGTLERHEEQILALAQQIVESNKAIMGGLSAMRQDLGDLIATKTSAIQRDVDAEMRAAASDRCAIRKEMADDVRASDLDMERIKHLASARTALIGALAGAVPAMAGLVYLLMRLAQ